MNHTDITQHMQLVEQAIGRTFVDNGLPVHLLGGVQGPHTLTFGLRLYQPTATNLGKAQKLAPAVEAILGDGPVRIALQRGVVWVETPSPVPTPIPGWQLEGRGLAVPLGLTSRRTVAGVDFAQDPHLLLVGPTGRGKTTAARAVVFHLARQNAPQRLRLLAVTFKPGDWQAFSQLAHSLALVTEPQEAAQLLAWLTNLMHRRAAAGRTLPRLVLFLDDLLNLLALVDVASPLTELASLGRGAGIHLVIATQRLGKRGAGDAAVTGNIPVRLVFGTADAQDASFFTGRGLVLAGGVGCGKSHMAVGMGILALGLGFQVYATTFGQLLLDIRATWSGGAAASEQRLLRFMEEVDLLILDDLGMEKPTAWALDRLAYVVNLRYSAGRALLVTSNLAPEELRDHWGTPVLSRLYHTCQAVSFAGAPDFRKWLRAQAVALPRPVWPGTDAEVIIGK